MTRKIEAAARAVVDAAKPDRADHGRTVLVSRALVEALRRAIEEDRRATVDTTQAES